MKLLDNLNYLDSSARNQLNLRLLDSMMGGKLPHAFLFWGASSNLYPLALAFAASINCSKGGCGHCQVCSNTLKGIYSNLLVVEADGNILTVDKIKQIQDYCSLTPFDRQKKVVIVKEAERLNDEASNKFLKTLEDPPGPDCVFILLSPQPGRLLATIQSRCLQFEWSFTDEDSQQVQVEGLEELIHAGMRKVIQGDLKAILGLGKQIGDMVDSSAQKLKKKLKQQAKDEQGQDSPDKNLIKRKAARFNRLGMEKVFDIIVAWLEDMVAVMLGAGSNALHYGKNYSFLDSSLMGASLDDILGILENIEENRYYLNRSINGELVLDSIFLSLRKALRGDKK